MIKWVVRFGAAVGVLLLLFVGTMLLLGGGREVAVVESSTVISRPAATIFPWLTEPARLKQWLGGLVEIVPQTEGGARLGARSREVLFMDGQSWPLQTEITGFEPPRRLVVHVTGEGFTDDHEYLLEEHQEAGVTSTQITVKSSARYQLLFSRLMAPLVNRDVERTLRKNFATLKGLVEREPPLAPRPIGSGPAFKGCCAEPAPGQ